MTHFPATPVLLPPETSPRRPRLGRLSRLSRRRQQSLWIGIAVLVSVLIHILAFGVIAVAGHRSVSLPTKEAEVELLMVERQGTHAASPAPQPAQRPQTAQSAPPKPVATPKPPPETPQPPVAKSGEPLPQPAPKLEQPTAGKPPTPPDIPAQDPQPSKPTKADKPTEAVQQTPPTNEKAPKIDFTGTGADSDADVMGGHVLPASPDNRFRNMPPPYPTAAAERGEHGTVTVMIHVDADGAATGADVIESSGFATLDASAVDAVKKWHFHPALRNAQPIPFDFPFRFEFRQQWTNQIGP